jgi:SAM-dependent methyltransferase
MTAYDDSFYKYTTLLARQAASVVCPLLFERLRPRAVLDVGCGQGAWLAEWQRLGAEVHGIDFPGAASDGLLVPSDCFTAADLSAGFDAGKRYDLAQSLEVAEHLPHASAARFVAALAASADVVLFSAAPPGQGGDNHINEQPYGYWRDLWREAGFALFDWLRPQLDGNEQVAPWYRYNSFLFANAAGRQRLPEDILSCEIPVGSAIPDVAPRLYRLRRLAVNRIPRPLQSKIAKLRYGGDNRRVAGER